MKKYLSTILFIFITFSKLMSQELVFGVIDNNGSVIIPFEYEELYPSEKGLGLYPAKKEGKWGIIDTLGNTVIPFIYDKKPTFREQYINVELDGKDGALGYDGRIIVPCEYKYVNSGDNGIIYAESPDTKTFSIFNLAGRRILPPVYTKVSSFTEELIPVKSGGKWGLINTCNTIVLPFEFEGVQDLRNGFMAAYTMSLDTLTGKKEYATSIYDSRGRKVTKNTYDRTSLFTGIYPDSSAILRKDRKSGMIRLDGEDTVIVPFEFKSITFPKGFAIGIIEDFNDKHALISMDGEILSPFIYDYPYFSRNPAKKEIHLTESYKTDTGYIRLSGYVNEYGEIIEPFSQENERLPSSEGYHIESGQKINDSTYIFIGYPLDENGRSTKIITTGEMIHNGEKYGLMNDKSEVVIPLTYDLIRLKLSCHYPYSRWAYGVIHTYPPDNHVVVFHNGKWGILDVTENKFILEDWERINGVYNNQYIVGKKTSAPTP